MPPAAGRCSRKKIGLPCAAPDGCTSCAGPVPAAEEGRPLSQKGSLEEMYRVRRPLYQAAADVVLDNSISVREAAELIWKNFCENEP